MERDRYRDAVISGGRTRFVKPDPEWTKIVGRANEVLDAIRSVDYGAAPLTNRRPPREIMHEGNVQVSAQMIIDLEATIAYLVMETEELDHLARDIMDEGYRLKVLRTIETLKERMAERTRTKLTVVP